MPSTVYVMEIPAVTLHPGMRAQHFTWLIKIRSTLPEANHDQAVDIRSTLPEANRDQAVVETSNTKRQHTPEAVNFVSWIRLQGRMQCHVIIRLKVHFLTRENVKCIGRGLWVWLQVPRCTCARGCTCGRWLLLTLHLKDWSMKALELAAPRARICFQ